MRACCLATRLAGKSRRQLIGTASCPLPPASLSGCWLLSRQAPLEVGGCPS